MSRQNFVILTDVQILPSFASTMILARAQLRWKRSNGYVN